MPHEGGKGGREEEAGEGKGKGAAGSLVALGLGGGGDLEPQRTHGREVDALRAELLSLGHDARLRGRGFRGEGGGHRQGRRAER